MEHSNTRDLRDFGTKELHLAGKLLLAFRSENDLTEILGDIVTPEFNPDSKIVFLVDQNFRVAMLNHSGELEDWYLCDQCGNEGFKLDLLTKEKTCCLRFLKTSYKSAA